MKARDEAPEEPNELADEYYRYYRPANPGERDMVDSMVEIEWLRRGAALDTQDECCPVSDDR